MPRHVLWISIESITLQNSAALPGEKLQASTVLASLAYPRSGAQVVSRGVQFPVESGITFHARHEDFFAAGLFKEIVEDETILNLKIVDTEAVPRAERILLAIADAALGVGQNAAPYEMPLLLGMVASQAIGYARAGIGTIHDRVSIVGQIEPIRLRMSDLPSDRMNPRREAHGLIVPEKIQKTYQDLDPATHQPRTEFLRIPAGSANGEIVLRLAAVPE